jgi:hypothetical protein
MLDQNSTHEVAVPSKAPVSLGRSFRRVRGRSDAALVREIEAERRRREAMDRECPRTARLRDELVAVLHDGQRTVSAQTQLEFLYVSLALAVDAGQELTPDGEVELRRQIVELL